METQPNLEKEKEIEVKVLAIPEKAKLLTVVDNETMERANAFKLDIKKMIKEVDDFFKPMADKAYKAHKEITGKWNEVKAPLKEADDYVTNKVKGYLRKVKEEEEREAARLREIARKEEEERRLKMAEELEAIGNIEEADAILDEPITFIAPKPIIETPKVDNRMYRTTIKAKVSNRMAFLTHVKPEVLLDCLNETAWAIIEGALSKKAKVLGNKFKMEGVEVYEA